MKKTILIFTAICSFTNAQIKITLESAVETALKNNNVIKNQKLKANYAKALINASIDIPKTNIFGEIGQINSDFSDSKFGISQTFALPIVYKRQKQFLEEAYNSKIFETNLKEFEVKKTVTSLFYNYLTLKEKEKLLQKADTLLSKFFDKANLRLQKGETNILEKATAETQKMNVVIQLKQLQSEIEMVGLEFQLILNSDQICLPYELNFRAKIENYKIDENPNLKLFGQQRQLVLAETKLLKSKLWPEINIGYNINFSRGIGLDDAKQFHSAQIGLGIPLFGGSQNAKINSSKIAEHIAESEYQSQILHLKNEYNKLMTLYNSNLQIVNFFESNSNKNSKIIADVANKQFINGDINYLDFVMLINQAISIQNAYIEAVKSLNQCVIAINYLNFKN